jgi:hypothetical protein
MAKARRKGPWTATPAELRERAFEEESLTDLNRRISIDARAAIVEALADESLPIRDRAEIAVRAINCIEGAKVEAIDRRERLPRDEQEFQRELSRLKDRVRNLLLRDAQARQSELLAEVQKLQSSNGNGSDPDDGGEPH